MSSHQHQQPWGPLLLLLLHQCKSSDRAFLNSAAARGGVNFNDILLAAFTQIPKPQKDIQLKLLFALSGSASVKPACKHVDEIDPRRRRRLKEVQKWTAKSWRKKDSGLRTLFAFSRLSRALRDEESILPNFFSLQTKNYSVFCY